MWAGGGGPAVRSERRFPLADVTKPHSRSSDDSRTVANLGVNHSFVVGLGSSVNLTISFLCVWLRALKYK